MIKKLTIIWLFLLFTQIIVAAAILGVISPPPQEKYYYLNQKNFDIITDRLDSILLYNMCYMPNCYNKYEIRTFETHDEIVYKYWPIDSLIFLDITLNRNKSAIMLDFYHIEQTDYKHSGRINRFDYEESSLINQIKIIKLFENNVLHDLPYRSDTNFLQDCFNYMNRLFIEIFLYLSVPFYILTFCLPFILLYEKHWNEDNE